MPYLGVRLIAPQGRINLHEHQFRYTQAQRATDLPRDQFGNKRQRPLSRAAKFHHIATQIVGLDNRGQRSAFAQRKDIAGCGHGAQHGVLSLRRSPQQRRAVTKSTSFKTASGHLFALDRVERVPS